MISLLNTLLGVMASTRPQHAQRPVQETPRAKNPRATTKDPCTGVYKALFAALGKPFPSVTLGISYTVLKEGRNVLCRKS